MQYLDPVCQSHIIQKSSLHGRLLTKAPLNDALESQLLQA
jgi:hypothetical protein